MSERLGVPERSVGAGMPERLGLCRCGGLGVPEQLGMPGCSARCGLKLILLLPSLS